MGMESSAHAAAAVGIDGKKVSWGPTPSPRGERIEAIANLCLSALNHSYRPSERW